MGSFTNRLKQKLTLEHRQWAALGAVVVLAASAGGAGAMAMTRPSVDTQIGHFELDGLPLKLTAFEWRVLSALMLRKEAVIERLDLLERVYEGDADVDSNSLEVIVGRLRRKIGAERIETVRGRGYRLTCGGSAP